jgi:hypothetical protein
MQEVFVFHFQGNPLLGFLAENWCHCYQHVRINLLILSQTPH